MLDSVISESLASALQARTHKERGRQQKLASQYNTVSSKAELDEDDAGDGKGKDGSKGKEDGKDPDNEKVVPEVDDVIDKLNAFRSGRSFRDDEVQSSFSHYFERLSDAEKTALYSFAKGIAQIVTGEVKPKDAAEPGDHPADVKMTRSGPQTKHVDPNVIKKVSPPSKERKAGGDGSSKEDTTPPAPIKVRGK
jgi:hypothetical protein